MTPPLSRKRGSSVSFTRAKDTEDGGDEIHISLAPYIQTYLAHSGQGLGCCGIGLPVPFERAAPRSWWNPKFDSEILEEQFKRSAFPQIRLRFRYALAYILLVSLSWLVYFVIKGIETNAESWPAVAITFSVIGFLISAVLYLTHTDHYRSCVLPTSLLVASTLCFLSLIFLVLVPPYTDGLTLVGHFALCSEILLLIYTVVPMPLYACVGIGALYSILFEFLTAYLYGSEVARRKYFQDTEPETSRHFAEGVRTTATERTTSIIMENFSDSGLEPSSQSAPPPPPILDSVARIVRALNDSIFNLNLKNDAESFSFDSTNFEGQQDDGDVDFATTLTIRILLQICIHIIGVHILIMTFVRMRGTFMKRSSNLSKRSFRIPTNSSAVLLELIRVKPTMSANKILTSSIECMLKAMIEAIKQFDIERREGVNMRVGVHTGTVLCGIVGTKRFKFDVWSNDVTLANKLESTGKPGRVHLSERTLDFLEDQYLMEEGESINGLKTYFITSRKSDLLSPFVASEPEPTSISPLMQSRNRLLSCNSQTKPRPHYLHMVTNTSNYRLKANSLPSILDSENDEDVVDEKEGVNKSPTSTASCGKKKPRNKPWRYLQRQRTSEEMSALQSERTGQLVEETLGEPARDERNGFSKTHASTEVEMDPNPVPSSPLLPGQESISHASSICSRKDSGIRSRRSSIQQQLFLMNGMTQGDLLGHRVSGYYTSNSTLNSIQDPSSSVPPYPFPPAVTDTFGACFHKLRKQSDLQLIRCVQDNVSSQRSYFVKPPLSSVTLFFKNKEMEKEYRENAHKASEGFGGNPPTLATSRFNTYFDILISALVYSAITISLFLLCRPSIYFIVFFVIATLIQAFAVFLCVRQLLDPSTMHATFAHRIFKFFSRWYPWHVCGAVLVALPIVSILMNFTCNFRTDFTNFEYYYSYIIFVGLVHFCNFTQLNCWMKNLLVTVTGILFICLVASQVSLYKNQATSVDLKRSSSPDYPGFLNSSRIGEFTERIIFENRSLLVIPISAAEPIERFENGDEGKESRRKKSLRGSERKRIYNERLYNSEIFLDMALLLVLVWFLNREFEISYRLSFHGNAVAARDKARVQSMKNQADWLLHNIIPKYVADQLKTTAKYSQNHKAVGIIFASIVNFNELYDESYLGGKEYLRVLNELIGDFDELLEKPDYANVEKIKTIGSTFMAASGLNPQVRQHSESENTHLFQLLDFAVAMHKVICDFNQDLLGFKLILRVGYNFGDVTAGVIGATKLYYDIWGDAVNIASRMDSTGVAGKIQLPSYCLEVLSERYEFEPRGQVYVKGKDNMDVCLLIGKKNPSKSTETIKSA
ncbi:adenylate cyclase type 9 [Belonocnema kinseyi]|uniref:adenylate cyclase type 9 n=1 Tax=Belonocnema kinseyi TaxID=2817044 RepID=UPI00143D78B6|nr:adenylate cyclase type 9 [Belonocnema kinseyi]